MDELVSENIMFEKRTVSTSEAIDKFLNTICLIKNICLDTEEAQPPIYTDLAIIMIIFMAICRLLQVL